MEESICEDCVVEPTLKRFLLGSGKKKGLCGVCGGNKLVLDRAYEKDFINLVFALVRFYYDETTYNRHWGGDDDFFDIFFNQRVPFFSLSSVQEAADVDSFVQGFLGYGAPPEEEGIWPYAGYTDGIQNMLKQSIKETPHNIIGRFRWRLGSENHFVVAPAMKELLEKLKGQIEVVVPSETRLWRARIGYEDSLHNTMSGEVGYLPFQRDGIGAPKPSIISQQGRINRVGVSYLYLATDMETAISELRPHPSHKVSTGEFVVVSTLRVADFSRLQLENFSSSEGALDLFHQGYSLGEALSEPILPDDGHLYQITQLIADVLREMGFDAVKFPSSISGGRNICLFESDDAEYVEGSGKVITVDRLHYGFSEEKTNLDEEECITGSQIKSGRL